MNIASDALETASAPSPPAFPRRDDSQPERIHYTNEFHVYQKLRQNGTGLTKRARCNHCSGDWAYNETRLKHHITDPYRGCRRIPVEVRERVRAADVQNTTNNNPTNINSTTNSAPNNVHTAPPLVPHLSPHQSTTPAKRKREPALSNIPTTPPQQIQTNPSVTAEPDIPVNLSPVAEAQPSHTNVRVAVEFSMTSGGLLRATWIASELISEFHRDILDVGLIPRNAEHTFNIWIGGKIAWSRGVGQPLPDYDHLRPIIRSQCCSPSPM